MKFAAFSGVLIDHSIQEALQLTKKLGFDGIEIAAREPHLSAATSAPRVKEIRTVADGLGLDIPVIAGYMGGFSTASDKESEQAFSEFQRMLEMSETLGASMIRVGSGGPNAFLAEDYHYAKAAFWLRKCAAEARKHDKRIVLEIHNVSLVETVESGLRLLDLVGEDNVGLIHDAGNMYITDTDYGRDSVIALGRKMFHVHVKDEKRVAEAGSPGTFVNRTKHGEEKFLQCRLGEGEADHQPLFDALKETGYDGWVTLECHAPFPAYERLEHDFRKVKQMLGLA
ncbi:sugar phosphate isomerase/epimerase family protein [Paenibacillus flagellatus]|uniref:Sugar phosphate isomerase/epimerase n=1 Tax=Paenibacillus flagellatus TaxID=2211139 RepID=A0A2V5K0Q1_9BACL|nr:sugar phosphate isomerase/epimerase family protein [Paenibacillus flagellatus]PYI52142.1 sugar phosphate isomerase/epimerase [Paenibacillus flagellatus]